jgi:hypothetical protein
MNDRVTKQQFPAGRQTGRWVLFVWLFVEPIAGSVKFDRTDRNFCERRQSDVNTMFSAAPQSSV